MNRIERDLSPLLFVKQRLGVRRSLDHADQGLGQQVAVETALEQIVLRPPLHCQLGDLLVLRRDQDQDGQPGRCLEQSIERPDSIAVGQKEIDQDRRKGTGSSFILRRQSREALGATAHPLDFE